MVAHNNILQIAKFNARLRPVGKTIFDLSKSHILGFEIIIYFDEESQIDFPAFPKMRIRSLVRNSLVVRHVKR